MSGVTLCEAGKSICPESSCPFCGAPPSGFCRGPKPEDPRNARIRKLEAELNEQNAQIVSLRLELASYREREKTMGWAQG